MYRVVALAIPYSRRIAAGVSRYLQTATRWRIDWVPNWASYLDPESWSWWEGDGLIAQFISPQPLEVIDRLPRPVVNVSDLGWERLFPTRRRAAAGHGRRRRALPVHEVGGPLGPAGTLRCLPTVHLDNVAVGRMGAEHFLQRGFRNLLFCGAQDALWSRQRWQGFRQAGRAGLNSRTAARAGLTVRLHDLNQAGHEYPRDLTTHILGRSLAGPYPLGVMADCDSTARLVARACLEQSIHVPEEVAILGVDNDELMCGLDFVPLSSVAPDLEQVGHLAAEMLVRLMDGAPPRIRAGRAVLVQPAGVVTRRSTNVLAVDDPAVAAALRFIWDHAAEPITVEQTAESVRLSRRSLDRRFQAILNRSPAEELLFIRLERARQLLRDTNMLMHDVARVAGFTNVNHLGRCFRRQLKLTPTAYRQQAHKH